MTKYYVEKLPEECYGCQLYDCLTVLHPSKINKHKTKRENGCALAGPIPREIARYVRVAYCPLHLTSELAAKE
jgi:hypothetical protein